MTLKHRLEQYNSPEGATEYFEEYEKLHRKLSDRRERRLLQSFFEHMGSLESAIDLPCGWGRYLPLLRANCSRVLQADYSGDMLRMSARVHAQTAVSGRFRASGSAFPLADQAVDLVFSIRLNHHLADPQDRIAHVHEMFRVARRFVVFTYFDAHTLKNRVRQWHVRRGRKRPKSTLQRAEVHRMAQEAGFRIVNAPLLFVLGSGHRLILAERSSERVA